MSDIVAQPDVPVFSAAGATYVLAADTTYVLSAARAADGGLYPAWSQVGLLLLLFCCFSFQTYLVLIESIVIVFCIRGSVNKVWATHVGTDRTQHYLSSVGCSLCIWCGVRPIYLVWARPVYPVWALLRAVSYLVRASQHEVAAGCGMPT